MSTSRLRTSTGTLPAACTPSQWTRAPRSRAIRTTSASGWITPVSLFASITATTAVSSSTRASARRDRRAPSAVARTPSTETPSSARRLRRVRDGVMLDRRVARAGVAPAGEAATSPRSAMLSASVPLPVNTISAGDAPIRAATWPRASSTAARARWPNQCRLEALPKPSRSTGSIASSTRGSSGVVALWSR